MHMCIKTIFCRPVLKSNYSTSCYIKTETSCKKNEAFINNNFDNELLSIMCMYSTKLKLVSLLRARSFIRITCVLEWIGRD
jgi:hypothetical protein